jgi:hypothetical protein
MSKIVVCKRCGVRYEKAGFQLAHVCPAQNPEQAAEPDYGGTKRTPDMWMSVRTFGARGHASDAGRGH